MENNQVQATYRTVCLSEANNIVNGARQAAYGSPEDSFATIAAFWNTYLGANPPLTSLQVANMMILLKMARVSSGNPTLDSYVDIAGYAACAYEGLRKIMEMQEMVRTQEHNVEASPESSEDYSEETRPLSEEEWADMEEPPNGR